MFIEVQKISHDQLHDSNTTVSLVYLQQSVHYAILIIEECVHETDCHYRECIVRLIQRTEKYNIIELPSHLTITISFCSTVHLRRISIF